MFCFLTLVLLLVQSRAAEADASIYYFTVSSGEVILLFSW